MKKTLTIHVDSREHSQLQNSLLVAIERFNENIGTLQKVADTGGNPFMSPDAARAVAEDFRKQVAATRMLLSFVTDMVEPFTIKAEEEEEESENPFHPESPEGRAWDDGRRDF